MTPEELEEAIGSGDPDRVVEVLAGATEAERKAAAEVPERWLTRVHQFWDARHTGQPMELREEQIDGILAGRYLAQIGTTDRPRPQHAFYVDRERGARVLADRRPTWLARWSEETLRDYPGGWPIIRLLVREGLIPRPDTELWVAGLIASGHHNAGHGPVLEEPDILEGDIWLLFEYEGNREASLSGSKSLWTATFKRLAEEGRLSRERLLDASLDALARDFIQYRAGWFSQFHEALSPTLDERAARLERYLHLLSSPIPPTVSFALKSLAVLEKAGRLPAASLVEVAGPALGAREKSTVTLALKLLGNAAKRDPELAPRAAEVAAEALLHEAPEIQGAALDLIEKLGEPTSPALRELLAARAGDVAASQRPRVEALLGSPTEEVVSEPAPDPKEARDLRKRAEAVPAPWRELAGIDPALRDLEAGSLTAPALDLPFAGIPRLDPECAVAPVDSLDVLIDAAAMVLETQEPPEAIERVLDGLSRLCANRPPDFEARTAPLRKRASKLLDRNEWVRTFWGSPRQDLAALVLAWTTGEMVKRKPHKEENLDLDLANGMRAYELARRIVKRQARPLLSFPTHTCGWIDPRILVERAREHPGWEPVDAVVALLRLAPDGRPEALEAAAAVPEELGDALRHALGAPDVPVGPTAALWAAAARARDPLADDLAVEVRHPGLGPDTGRAARLSFRVEHETSEWNGVTYHHYPVVVNVDPPVPNGADPSLVAVLHHVNTAHEPPARRWCATLWPAGRRAWLSRGVVAVGNNIDWWEAEWSNRVYLEALLEPDTPVCEMGRLLLALGLGAKEPGESGLSIDALIATICDGRIDGPTLGDTLATLSGTGRITGARWAKTLGQAGRASPLHREVVREALERLLAAAPRMRPADLGALLTLHHELCVESAAAVRDEAARTFLSGIKSGKSGATAKGLLQLSEGDRVPHLAAAAATALEGRLDRAERWRRWASAA